MRTWILLSALFALVLSAPAAFAQCSVGGEISASPNPDPAGPAWIYTISATWDTGNPYGLSHIDVLVDEANGNCSCADLQDAFSFPTPAGSGDGVPAPCSVDYTGAVECNGDPSIPGEDGRLLKFEPVEGTCEPGPVGSATLVFYSDFGPVPIEEPCICIVDKAGLTSCMGLLVGDFPGLPCDPVATESETWGAVKSLFAR